MHHRQKVDNVLRSSDSFEQQDETGLGGGGMAHGTDVGAALTAIAEVGKETAKSVKSSNMATVAALRASPQPAGASQASIGECWPCNA